MMGAGTSTCAFFGQQFKENPQAKAVEYMSWAQGFMTGENALMIATNGLSRDLSAHGGLNGQAVFLQDYCDAHPLLLWFDAVSTLYSQLPLNKPTTAAR